ncbi:MAG: ATP-binding protein [Brevibacterium sp.]|nr:ATP-binding protein [Brevibacterium sp.]
MDVDLSRLPTGISGWLSLVNHALALGDLSEVDYLELKGSLSFDERQNRKRSAVVLSRTIIGMANRMPDLAEKHLSGSGVILVGIDQQKTLVGVEKVDAAVLHDSVGTYVGADGPQWDHQFIEHSDGLVLAIIVNAPQWGDRIHACRKDYTDDTSKLSVRDGEVYVRTPGKTRPATSHDLKQLECRRVKAPHTGARVSIEYSGAFDRISRDNVQELIESLVKSAADEMIEGIPASARSSSNLTGVRNILEPQLGNADRRTVDQFRADVKRWQDECQAAVESAKTEFLRQMLNHGTFEISNKSDRYLENVRARVKLRPNVTVLMVSDSAYCDHVDNHGRQFPVFQMMPDKPPHYGELKPYQLDYSTMNLPKANRAVPRLLTSNFHVEATSDSCIVSWYIGDLPPRTTARAKEKFSVFTDVDAREHFHDAASEKHESMPTEIGGTWSVTARAVDYVFRGAITVPCRQESGDLTLWSTGR